MNIQALTDLFSDQLGQKVYNLNFPEFTEGEFIKVEPTTGMVDVGGLKDFNLQFMTKANHPKRAEHLAIELINSLHQLRNKEFGGFQLVLMSCQAPIPNYLGETPQGEFLYSVDFRILATKL